MKSFRLITALVFTAALITPAVHAGEKAKDEKKAEAACSCGKDKDGKECGKDKECCCKAKDEKKDDAKK